MTKTLFSAFAALIALALSASLACAADLLKLRAGVDASSFSYQFRVADGAGIFEKYGFEAEVFTFSYGIDTLNSAILGETDSAQAADFAVASRLSIGNNLRILSHILTYNIDGTQLWTRNPEVKAPGDLKGKRLGVQKGTVNEYVWAQFFIKQSINPKEVKQIYLSSTSELLAAFQAGELDALWLNQENVPTAAALEGARKLGNFADAGFYPRAFVLLDAAFIEKHEAKIPDLLRALQEATVFLKEKPDQAAELIAKDLRIPLDAARKGIDTYTYEIRFLQEDLQDLVDVAAWSIENGLIKNAYDVRKTLYLGAIKSAFPDKVTVQE
ncbi:MAG: ABC transporter substrate-binding protein [Deltaproteobacteria bacterium]|jgi:NitT/TauT family transport system substrate-binding protein|nr:ABC transporter substrate-binding protein [Deltaproteobacteria bacterium]